jgi:hypothetical protein
MAQRKSGPSASSKSGPAKVSTARPGGPVKAAKAGPAKGAPTRPPARPPVKKKPGKSIVNQKQTPWGLIVTTVVIVLFAAAIVTYAVANHKSSPKANSNPYRQPELAAAKQISGLTYKVEPNHTHVEGSLKYDASPPIGGNHSQYWADCTGTVYPKAIASENAVHMLEHGAIWITYKPGLPAAQLNKLKELVTGQDHMALSPYPGLRSNISLQAWGYQLFLNKADDPRIQQFVGALRYNSKTTPEHGASCSQPTFKTHPSTFGHPLWVPAT